MFVNLKILGAYFCCSYGRVDCSTSPDTAQEDYYPNANGDSRETLDYWKNYFGFTYHETVALIGAHSLGKCHR
jgi:hypothetical protein